MALSWRILGLVVSMAACEAPGVGAPCQGGSWQRGALEIHHIDVGQADATLIVGPTGRTLLVDVGEPTWDGDTGARIVGDYLRGVLGCARVDQVLITHFHVDHIGYPGKGGLWHLVNHQGFTVAKVIHRDAAGFRGDGGRTIDRWTEYLAGAGAQMNPETAREGNGQIDLGPHVSFRVVAVDGHGVLRPGDFRSERAPPNENDYSIASLLRFGRFDYFIGGDLSGERSVSPFGYAYHDIETAVARGLPDVDVYRVNHHGSNHSSNPTFLAQLDPEVSVISTGDGNPHGHPRQPTVDRLRATSVLYLTGRGAPGLDLAHARIAGHVVLRTRDGVSYSVDGDPFEATDPPRMDADGDGYFREADPDDAAVRTQPAPRGGCDPVYQRCSDS